MFIFFRKLQNVFNSGCIILDANQQFMGVLGFLQYHQHLVLALFLIIGFSWMPTVISFWFKFGICND